MACTILIVDDHPSFRASARVVLESEGFDVVGEAADGASAIAGVLPAPARRSSCSTCSCPTSTASTCAQQITAHLEHPVVIMTSSRDSL